jgi:polyferredoxin
MDRIGYPRGLVRYTTQHALEREQTHVLRPRVLVYGTILALLAGGFLLALALRSPVALDVIRDRNSLYRLLDDGRVENVYTLKVLNKSERDRSFALSVSGAGSLSLDPAEPRIDVTSGEVLPVVVRVRRDAYQPAGSETIHFRISARDDARVTASHEARLLAPAR